VLRRDLFIRLFTKDLACLRLKRWHLVVRSLSPTSLRIARYATTREYILILSIQKRYLPGWIRFCD
jgi:hypothetical protein